MKNLRIGVKLAIAIGILLFGLLLLGGLAIYNLAIVNDQSKIIATSWLPSVDIAGRFNSDTSDYRIAQGTHVLSTDAAEMAKAEAEIAALDKVIAEDRKIYEPLIADDQERALYEKFSKQWENYLAVSDKVVELSRKNAKTEATTIFMGEAKQHFDDAEATIVAIVDFNHKGADTASAYSDTIYVQARLIIVAVFVVMLTFGVVIGWALIRGISGPARDIAVCLQTMSTGNLNVAVPGTNRRDEMGDIAKASLVFQEGMIKARDLAAEQRAEQERQIDRGGKMEDAIGHFDRVISEIVAVVTAAATQLQATAQVLTTTAEETSRQSTVVAAASEEMTQNIQTVASATEELSASISEISSQVTESTRIVGEAVGQATETNTKVKSLSDAAQKIGDVVELINNIASQTNLLALNATIEAARAGEAGKGFAVVASEVKTLATQTARATDEIGAQIRSIQDATDSSANAIAAITATIGRVNEISTTIASTVEEQGAATQEISRNVQQAATGSAEVATNITGVTEAAQQTSSGSTEVLGAATELAQNGERLKKEVDSFLHKVRSL